MRPAAGPALRVATRAGARLPLAPKEFAVLELLLAAQGRVVSAEELLERVWDEMADPFTGTVKVTISRLRAKLGDPGHPDARPGRLPDQGPVVRLPARPAARWLPAHRAAAPHPAL